MTETAFASNNSLNLSVGIQLNASYKNMKTGSFSQVWRCIQLRTEIAVFLLYGSDRVG